jgi:hypothetical protein
MGEIGEKRERTLISGYLFAEIASPRVFKLDSD